MFLEMPAHWLLGTCWCYRHLPVLISCLSPGTAKLYLLLWLLISHVNLIQFRNAQGNQGDAFGGFCIMVFSEWISVEGNPTLNVGDTIPWASWLSKKEKRRLPAEHWLDSFSFAGQDMHQAAPSTRPVLEGDDEKKQQACSSEKEGYGGRQHCFSFNPLHIYVAMPTQREGFLC